MPEPIYYTTGGFETAAIYSGQVAPSLTSAPGAVAVGSDVLFQSGPGRLISITPHQTFLSLSGQALPFYDGAAPVSGGPLPASGHIFLGGLPNGFGVSGQIVPAGIPIPINLTFNSGLCYNSRSGQPGVTVHWAQENLLARRQG
jgi:hypothetical protein